MTSSCIHAFPAGRRILIFALLWTSALAQSPPKSAQDAYDQIQALRVEGRKLIADAPQQALMKFGSALRYWRQPLVQDLARGDMFLDARYLNLCLDFAETHVKLGHKAEAVDWLEKVHRAGGFDGFARYLQQNQSFQILREEPAFKKLLEIASSWREFWESDALKTPYNENLSDAEKIAGLSKFWSEVKYNFAYPERLSEIDWDQIYLQAIPKALDTKGPGR